MKAGGARAVPVYALVYRMSDPGDLWLRQVLEVGQVDIYTA